MTQEQQKQQPGHYQSAKESKTKEKLEGISTAEYKTNTKLDEKKKK